MSRCMINCPAETSIKTTNNNYFSLFEKISLAFYWYWMDWMSYHPANLRFFPNWLKKEYTPDATNLQKQGTRLEKRWENVIDTLLQIEGFTENHVKEFVTKYFKERPDLASKLSKRMSWDKNLRGMAANPLNTAPLCLLCDEFEGTLPENRAQLYLHMIECVLRRKKWFHWQLSKSFGTGLNLINLNLYDNGISYAGATSIAKAIKINKTPTNLNLFDNGVSHSGGPILYIFSWGNQSQQDQFKFLCQSCC